MVLFSHQLKQKKPLYIDRKRKWKEKRRLGCQKSNKLLLLVWFGLGFRFFHWKFETECGHKFEHRKNEHCYIFRLVSCRKPSLIRNKNRPGVAIKTSISCLRLSNWVFCLKPPVATIDRNGTPDFDSERQTLRTCKNKQNSLLARYISNTEKVYNN